MHALVYSTFAAIFLGAGTQDAFPIRGDSATVIEWLTKNRDVLLRVSGARVLRHDGPTIIVSKEGFTVYLHESAKRWQIVKTDRGTQFIEIQRGEKPTAANYHVQLAARHHKLRSWTTDITVQPYLPGWTWITFSVQGSVNGPGEGRLQGEIDAAVARMKAYLLGVFR